MHSHSVILASGSPRRREILSLLGIDFRCVESKVDETLPDLMPPHQSVMALARRKAQAVSRRYPEALCIGADTMVTYRGMVLGKPKDRGDADSMLRLLSDDRHDVYTGLCVCHGGLRQSICDYRRTTVRFLPIDDDSIQAYVQTGEPWDKAGAYGIQGWASQYVHSIIGSYDNVVGLPLSLLRQMLGQMGFRA